MTISDTIERPAGLTVPGRDTQPTGSRARDPLRPLGTRWHWRTVAC
jgi:hypothetical protein